MRWCRKAGRQSRRSQRSQRSYEESTVHRPSEALDEAEPPRGVDFDTRRQFYAAQLEKKLDGVSAEEVESRDGSATPSNNAAQSDTGGASPSVQAFQSEDRGESYSNRLSTSSPKTSPSQRKVFSAFIHDILLMSHRNGFLMLTCLHQF